MYTVESTGCYRWPIENGPGGFLGPREVVFDDYKIGYVGAQGAWVAVGGVDANGTVTVIDLNNPSSRYRIQTGNRYVYGPTVSPDGKILAITRFHESANAGPGSESGVRLWETRTGEFLRCLVPEGLFYLEFSEDGRHLLASNGDEYFIWACASWQLVRHVRRARTTSENSTDEELAKASDRLIILDPDSLETLLALPTSIRYHPVRFLPRSRLLALALEEERYVLLWDVPKVRTTLRELGLDWDRIASLKESGAVN